MDIELTIKNYRCFEDTYPVRLRLHNGFTAFVGVNNSGKSSLLKSFYELRPLFRKFSSPSSNLIEALRGKEPFSFQGKNDKDAFNDRNERELTFEVSFPHQQLHVDQPQLTRAIFTLMRTGRYVKARFYTDSELIDASVVNSVTTDTSGDLRIGDKTVSLSPFYDVFKSLADALYIGPFRNTINVKPNEEYFDIQVGQSFIEAWQSNKTGDNRNWNDAIHRVTEDIKRIFEFDSLEINSSFDNTDLKIYADGRNYRLVDLGSGLSQFIVVLGNAAIRNPSFILIDEPELNLHPRLQLDFLTSLGAYAREGVLFATHNIGLARATAQEIYTVTISDDTNRTRQVRPLNGHLHLSEFLGELGYSGYRELGFTKILLVEGPTEVTAIQQLLRLYGKDHEILLMPLGGSSLINGTDTTEKSLQELTRITTDIFAVVDSERQTAGAPLSPDRQGFVNLCKKVGINCCVLDFRAIENYFPDSAVKRAKGPKYSALSPYLALSDASLSWSKSDNWKIAREIHKQDLANTDLGQFLDKI